MKKNWKNFLLKGICLTSVAFVFQACYGTPQDFGMDTFIEGKVNAKKSGLPIQGIKVSVENSMQYTYTDNQGYFSLYTEKRDSTKLNFADIDSTENNSYIDKDTLLTTNEQHIYLNIELDQSK